MKHIHYLYIAALTFLIACSSEERITTDSNEDPSGPIELSAGILEGSTKATTRSGAEDNHANHQALNANTKLALRVSGTWTGHGESPYAVVKTTTATVGAETSSGSKHNSLTCSPLLYWDDYGSADPANATTGRTEGLTIYGAAINGKTIAPSVSDWTALSWTLPANQTASESTPADKDLLISNNIKAGTGDGTYKFDSRASGKLLEFTHALSKITVNLNANNGFTDGVFASDPEVKLTSNNASTSYAEWAYTTGTINITTGAVSSQSNPAVITMWQAVSAPDGYDITKEALIIPGSQFSADDAIIARINADGNIYYVTAEKIRTAISASHASEGAYSTEAGKNYIINVTVNKTDIVVTATVANWTNISADEVAPVINVSGDLGGSAVISADKTFSFYRSSFPNINLGYSNDESLKENNYYKEESVLGYTHSTTTWTMSPVLYWPNHNTHYQFRAVWPRTVTTTTGDEDKPRVVREVPVGQTSEYQLIKVHNEAYTPDHFPSDLMIARPDVPNGYQNCGNNEVGHQKVNLYTNGICAREGTINLKFKYMMAQVEVILTTTDTDYDKVKLDDAIVELVNVHKTGSVKLGSMEVVTTGTSPLSDPVRDTFGDYTLDYNSTSKHYHSAIVPQPLTFSTPLADGNLKFRIKIMNAAGDAVDDIYYADIKPISVKVTGSSDAAAPVTNWESGKHYVYTLHLSKTEIKVTATLANWTEVTASQTVWF
jgi:hypothetical protein